MFNYAYANLNVFKREKIEGGHTMVRSLKLGTKVISLLIFLVIFSVSVIGIISTNSQVSVINDNLTYTTKELSISLS